MKIFATRRDKEEDAQRCKDKEAREAPAPGAPAQLAPAPADAKKQEAVPEFADYDMEALF